MSLFFLGHADLVICPTLTLYMTDKKYTALFLHLLITADKPAAAFQKMSFYKQSFEEYLQVYSSRIQKQKCKLCIFSYFRGFS